jgi:hypothetical protein
MMAAEAQNVIDTPRLEFGVWLGISAGPVGWALDLGFSYALAQHACSTGHFYVLHVISLICFVLALTGFVLAFGTYRHLPEKADKQGHLPRDRAFFLSLVGIVMSLFFAAIIIAEAVPRWVLSPCS